MHTSGSITDTITNMSADARTAIMAGLVVVALLIFTIIAWKGKTLGSILTGGGIAILLIWVGHNITSSKVQDPINQQLDGGSNNGLVKMTDQTPDLI